MSIIKTLSGPIIGAVIGYFTNYIAVKMLFRPLHPIKIGKYTLPFTPGIIPKRKNEMARALGTMVGNTLITGDDLEKVLLSDGMKQSVTEGIAEYIMNQSDNAMTIKDTLNCCVEEKNYQDGKEKLEQLVSEKIAVGLSNIDLGKVIVSEGGAAVKEKVKGTMLAMFVNDEMISSIAEPIGDRVKEYIQDQGAGKIQPVVQKEIEKIESKTVSSVLSKMQLSEKQIQEVAGRIYTDCITSKVNVIIKQFDVAGIVKSKIQDMPVEDIETLVLSVMKTELDAVVNLGAVIGLILGLFNMIF